MILWSSLPRTVLLAGVALLITGGAQAGVVVTLGAPRAEFANFTGPNGVCATHTQCVYGTETFAGWTGGGFTSAFVDGQHNFPAGTAISGTYAGAITHDTDNTYGGAYGTQPYPAADGTGHYTLSLAAEGVRGANYFGVWITAMDPYNVLTLSSAGATVFSLGSADLRKAIAATTNPGAYYGDPDNGGDTAEPFAYVNIYDTSGFFDRVTFGNNGPSNFESSNDSVGYFASPNVSGVPVAIATNTVSVPEPESLTMVLPALALMMAWRARRRRSI